MDKIIESFKILGTSAISDALDKIDINGQCFGLQSNNLDWQIAGRAFTVKYGPVDIEKGTVGDFIDDVVPGDIVVIDNQGRLDCTVWGDIMTGVAKNRGIAGTVIDGVCRDTNRSIEIDYPVFSVGRYMRTGKDRVQEEFIRSDISFDIEGVELELSAIHRSGNLAPIIFLHGFGSTKEDYADIIQHSEFDNHPFIAYDAPGCGETYCSDVSKISIPFLMETALAVIDRFDYDKFHIVGHSMGGLTALMMADKYPDRVLSFTNIEGNISPEDCFLSRQIIDHPNNDPDQFFDDFIERTRHSLAYASALYAVGLRQKVRAGAVKGIFESMVELSDHGDLMNKFLNLPFPKMFMYGEQNDTLSYLKYIEDEGVRLSEVPECGHFPMYSNPPHMWHEMAEFQNTADRLTEVPYE